MNDHTFKGLLPRPKKCVPHHTNELLTLRVKDFNNISSRKGVCILQGGGGGGGRAKIVDLYHKKNFFEMQEAVKQYHVHR